MKHLGKGGSFSSGMKGDRLAGALYQKPDGLLLLLALTIFACCFFLRRKAE
jgi:hypothetical protein